MGDAGPAHQMYMKGGAARGAHCTTCTSYQARGRSVGSLAQEPALERIRVLAGSRVGWGGREVRQVRGHMALRATHAEPCRPFQTMTRAGAFILQ